MLRTYNSLHTGNITLRIIKYSTFQRKKLRYIMYDSGLGWNIFEEIGTQRKYALTDSALFGN